MMYIKNCLSTAIVIVVAVVCASFLDVMAANPAFSTRVLAGVDGAPVNASSVPVKTIVATVTSADKSIDLADGVSGSLTYTAPTAGVALGNAGGASPVTAETAKSSGASVASSAEQAAIEGTKHLYIDTEDDIIRTVRGSVVFRVNRTEIDPDAAFVKLLREELLRDVEAQHLELYRIDVRGAASPEGPIKNNERLARGRTRVLVDTITSILPSVTADLMNSASVTEDYEYLVQMMAEANDPDTELVRSICEKWKHSIPDLKWSLFTAKKRTLWPRLLKEYFPQLRATRVILYFRERAPKEPASPTLPEVVVSGSDSVVANPCRPGAGAAPDDQCPCCKAKSCQCEKDSIGCRCHEHRIDSIAEPVEEKTYEHRRPLMSIGTNLLYDAFYMPRFGMAPMWNGRLEYYPLKGHFTYAIAYTNPYYHKWNKYKFFQIRNYEVEARFYFRKTTEADYRGWYMSVAADVNKYGIGLGKRDGREGEGIGAQLTAGYVLPLNKCHAWKLHFTIGAGYYYSKYDPYLYGIPDKFGHYEDGDYYYDTDLYRDQFKKRQHRFTWFGPTQVGISLSYDFLWRKERGGASFRHHEKKGGDR